MDRRGIEFANNNSMSKKGIKFADKYSRGIQRGTGFWMTEHTHTSLPPPPSSLKKIELKKMYILISTIQLKNHLKIL